MSDLEICLTDNSDDLKQCLEIRNAVFTMEKGVPKEIEVDEYDCLNELCDHFLIKHQGNSAGTLRCFYLSESTIKIQRFCFRKGYRKLGLGKAALEYIENYYGNQGITKIVIDAKYEVCGFYEKCGYKRVSDIFMEADIEHVKMTKEK